MAKKWSPAKFKKLREAKFPNRGGLSEAAKRASIQPSHLQRYEKGERTPSVDTAAALAEAVGVRVDDLLA